MPVPDLFTPQEAVNIAQFGGDHAGRTARLSYDVPLPGAYSWQRIVPLELKDDQFSQAAASAGASFAELGVVAGARDAAGAVNGEALASFYRRALPAETRPSLRRIAAVNGNIEPLLDQVDRKQAGAAEAQVDLLGRRAVLAEPDDVVRQGQRVDSYIQRLAAMQTTLPVLDAGRSLIDLPIQGIGQSIHVVQVDPMAEARPRLTLVETWEIRSYLGDYGLGRTLQTFSLLPGERTTITVSTWRSEAATREDSSSIFDSSDTAAQTRFTNSLANQTGSASQESGGWAASVSTSASAGASLFGLVSGSVSVNAGFSANHQEASQRFSNSVTQCASEHAAQVNNSRRQSVDSASSSTSSSGSATTTVREISNTNLRRVLNFVFRELNQVYETYVVLRDIKIGFYNGRPGSAEVVPLANLDQLLRKYIVQGEQEDVARRILGLCAARVDFAGDQVPILEVGTNPDGISYQWAKAELQSDGLIDFAQDTLAPDVRWRFRPGVLSRDGDERGIGGVVMDKSAIVLRTDNLVVEALLGQADAVDPYASALQALDVLAREGQNEARSAETRHDVDALDLVASQQAGDKITAWQKIFAEGPEIEVVSAAAVAGHNGAPA